MYIQNAIFKEVPTAGLSFPLAEGSVITAGGVTGIVAQNIAQAPPTARIYIAVSGTIDLEENNVNFTDEQIKALGSDFNFVPAKEITEPENELPAVTSEDNGCVLTVVSGAWAKAASVIPAFAVGDAGKVLKVNEAGTGLEWATDETAAAES